VRAGSVGLCALRLGGRVLWLLLVWIGEGIAFARFEMDHGEGASVSRELQAWICRGDFAGPGVTLGV
jgi:hypothetical protein